MQKIVSITTKLKLGLLSTLFLLSLLTGISGSYTLFILAILNLFFLLGIFLFNRPKASFDSLLIVLALFGTLLLFHVGILVRNNLWEVCTPLVLKDRRLNEYNIKPISLAQIEQEIDIHRGKLEKDLFAEIKYKGSIFPVHIINPKIKDDEKSNILIIAGTHGSEPAGVFAAMEILKKIQKEKLLEQFDISIIYALNPVGLKFFNRFNECNCDINRDYLQKNTIQSKLMRNFLKTNDVDFVLDLHEGPYNGHYVLENTSFMNFRERLLKKLEYENITPSPMMSNWLHEHLFKYLLDSPVKHIDRILRLDNHLDEIGIENIISESNVESKNMEKRIKGHVLVFETLIENLKESISSSNSIKD